MMENFEFEEKFNPWNIESLEDLHFYCCPQCDFRNLSKSEFIKHTVMQYPESQDVIDKLEGKKHLKGIKWEICESIPHKSDLKVPKISEFEEIIPKNQKDDKSPKKNSQLVNDANGFLKLKKVKVTLTKLRQLRNTRKVKVQT